MAIAVEQLDGETASRVRLGRSKFLGVLGTLMFGYLVQGIVAAEPAYASTCGSASPCGPSPLCCCCSGSTCCSVGCHARVGECHTGGQCWTACLKVDGNCCKVFSCCDWWTAQGERCICRTFVRKVC
jgi:hypothetical protein